MSDPTLRYGTHTFDPMPFVGVKPQPRRQGERGPMSLAEIVSVRGFVITNSYSNAWDQLQTLKTALTTDRQALYFHDGSSEVLNLASGFVLVEDPDIPAEYGQPTYDYSVSFVHHPLSATDNVTLSTAPSYNGYTFDPVPVMSRSVEPQRDSKDGAQIGQRVTVMLSGQIQKGVDGMSLMARVNANLAEMDALELALSTDDATLRYGALNQTVKVGPISWADEFPDRAIGYNIEFYWEQNLTDGVIELTSSMDVTRAGQRVPFHEMPYEDGSSYQVLGAKDQTIRVTVRVKAQTLAQAKTAAATEIDALFPAAPDGVFVREIDGRSNENARTNQVDLTVTKRYTQAVLTGGIYGTSS